MGTIPFEPIPLPVALSLKACYTSVASGYWHRYEAPLRQLSSRFITRDSRYQPRLPCCLLNLERLVDRSLKLLAAKHPKNPNTVNYHISIPLSIPYATLKLLGKTRKKGILMNHFQSECCCSQLLSVYVG